MCNLESFKVDLREVKDEVKTLVFDLDDNYFKVIDGPEVKSGAVRTTVSVRNTVGVYELRYASANQK